MLLACSKKYINTQHVKPRDDNESDSSQSSGGSLPPSAEDGIKEAFPVSVLCPRVSYRLVEMWQMFSVYIFLSRLFCFQC